MRRHRLPISLATIAAASALLAGCGSSSAGAGSAPTDAGTSANGDRRLSGSISVFAASSLTEVFGTLGRKFEKAHPGTTVTFNFAASTALVAQITQGAPADVFAPASDKAMDAVVAARAADSASTYATNVMEIAVPPANPAKISALGDLARPGVKVAVCQAAVPCGTVTEKVFANADLTVKPVTEEADVKATLSKVELGEVDAGVVYVTDVLAARNKVRGIEIPADVNASTSYPIATLSASKNAALAKAFVAYVLSRDGAGVLTAAGFRKP